MNNRISFGTDGIRQSVGAWPLTAHGLQQIGLGIGKYLKTVNSKPRVLIGRDTRISGDFLLASLCSGLLAYGVDVVDVGVITTAGVAYLTRRHAMDVGFVISASHNPWTENGIKLMGPSGFKLSDEVEKAIEDNINSASFDPSSKEYGRLATKDEWVEEYVDYLISPFRAFSFENLRLVVDCSNGAASQIAPRCFELLGAQITVLHNAPTGFNINVDSGSEVVREGKGDLIAMVKSEGATFGIAFDGDADRAIFVDEKGNLVDGDHILYILARYLDSRNDLPDKRVITTEMANSGLDVALSKVGVEVTHTKVGDKYVVRELQKGGHRLGGEQSGHIIIFDAEHTTGDGIYTALFLGQVLLSGDGLPLSVLSEGLVKLPQVIASAYVSKKPPLNDLDEFIRHRESIVTSLGEDVILNTRYSGTEPLFRVMIQGTGNHTLHEITRQAVRLCRGLQSLTGDGEGWLEVKDCTTGDPIDVAQFDSE